MSDSQSPAEGPVGRAFRRAAFTARRYGGRLAELFARPPSSDPLGVWALVTVAAAAWLVLVLPFALLSALTADVWALAFGGVGRSIVSCTALSLLLVGCLQVFADGRWPQADELLPLALMSVIPGVLAGSIVGFLAGPIFCGLPEKLDRELAKAN